MKRKNVIVLSLCIVLVAVIAISTVGVIHIFRQNNQNEYDSVVMSGVYGEVYADTIDDESDIVVRATVTQKGELYMPDMSLPQKYSQPDYVPRTDYTLEVSEVYKGSPAENIIVRVMGGTYDGIEYKLDRDPDLKVGDEYLLFLREGDMYKKSADDLHYEILAVSAGCFKVENGVVKDNGLLKGDFNDLLNFLDS
jgi:hypothetical protein